MKKKLIKALCLKNSHAMNVYMTNGVKNESIIIVSLF